MKKTDARTLTPSAQYELRKQIVRLKQAGRSGREISEISGLSPEHISRVWRRFQKEGASAIKINWGDETGVVADDYTAKG